MPAEHPVRHPLFARFQAALAAKGEAAGVAEHRRRLLADARGRVLELGAGSGVTFQHYPASVTEVVAVEPEPFMRARAEEAAERAPVPVRVVDALSQALPVGDDSFDVAVAALVLCTVPDPAAALAELRRVLRPRGELRFYEHVRSEHEKLARVQTALDAGWPRVAGGCHTSRDTASEIERAGFAIERIERFTFRPCVLMAPVSPMILGLARVPAAT